DPSAVTRRSLWWHPPRALVAALVLAACALTVVPEAAMAGRHTTDAATPPGALQQTFSAAAREFGVPESVLLAVSYNESRWESHVGPSTSGGYGVMTLVALGHDLSGG